jgi:hypothetical protein
MPAGADVTVPLPSPVFVTVSVKTRANVAVTDLAADIATVHVAPEALSHPDQPVNADPAAALAVRVTDVLSR